MKLTDHVALNLNNTVSTAAVLLDVEKAFDATWHSGLLYKLLFFLTTQIQCFGGRRNIYAKGNASWDALKFCPLPYFVNLLLT
jgi:hypothetical protein